MLLGTDLTLLLGYAFDVQCLAGPIVESEDPVGLRDDVPALDVADLAAALLPGFYAARRELSNEMVDLLLRKTHSSASFFGGVLRGENNSQNPPLMPVQRMYGGSIHASGAIGLSPRSLGNLTHCHDV
jgi:hypothetical protein